MPNLNNDSDKLGKVMDSLAGDFPGELAFDKTPYVVTDELGNVVKDANGDPVYKAAAHHVLPKVAVEKFSTLFKDIEELSGGELFYDQNAAINGV